jgi:hypothetical protein
MGGILLPRRSAAAEIRAPNSLDLLSKVEPLT